MDKIKEFAATPGQVEYFQKGDERIPFPKPVWDVVVKLHADGIDPNSLDRNQTIAWARHYLQGAPRPGNNGVIAAQVTASAAAEEPETARTALTPIDLPVRLAIYSLLVSALELTKIDRQPGAEALRKPLEPVVTAYLAAINSTTKAAAAAALAETESWTPPENSQQPATEQAVPQLPNPE